MACWIPVVCAETHRMEAACRHKEEPPHCQPEQLWPGQECEDVQKSLVEQGFSWRQCSADHLQSTVQRNSLSIQSKHITSCGRWTRKEIFLSNNFLAVVKVTGLTWLVTVLADMGQYRQLEQQGYRKRLIQKPIPFWEGLIAMKAWTKAGWSQRSDISLAWFGGRWRWSRNWWKVLTVWTWVSVLLFSVWGLIYMW